MEGNPNGKKQITKENMSYETIDRKFENCRKLQTILFKHKLLQQKHTQEVAGHAGGRTGPCLSRAKTHEEEWRP